MSDSESLPEHTPGRIKFKGSKRKRQNGALPNIPNERYPPPPPAPKAPKAPKLDSDVAFREALYDALSDPEGAAYWEGVFGQPIHTFPRSYVNENGRVQAMTDEEYVAFVQSELFRKSAAGKAETAEQLRKERTRKRKEDEESAATAEAERKTAKRIEKLLKKSQARKQKAEEQNAATKAMERYAKGWEGLPEAVKRGNVVMPWPTMSGRVEKEVQVLEVEYFLELLAGDGKGALPALLKKERVRWHPDKVGHRTKGLLSSEEMTTVTAVFQIIDRLYAETKKHKST